MVFTLVFFKSETLRWNHFVGFCFSGFGSIFHFQKIVQQIFKLKVKPFYIMDISYILNHLGEDREEYYGAVAPPVFQTSNFCFKTVGEMREKLTRELETPFYTRGYNPTVAILRKKIAALEGAEDALVFSSGSAAIAAAVMSVVKAGDHVICVQKPYSWTNNLLSNTSQNMVLHILL